MNQMPKLKSSLLKLSDATAIDDTKQLIRLLPAVLCLLTVSAYSYADEAPTGFDGLTNGLVDQTKYQTDKGFFDARFKISGGLGPVYNAESCAECHANPVAGGSSQVSALRAGQFKGGQFIEPAGGSLIHDRAINAAIQAKVPTTANVKTVRMSSTSLGDGFVEAIADETLLAIAEEQGKLVDHNIQGQVVMADNVEKPGTKRVGRFGWKSQHGSLLSFNAEALRTEMGITNTFFTKEHTSNGRSVAAYDTVAEPESTFQVMFITEFLRATKAPPRDESLAQTAEVIAGEQLFDDVGCAICHTSSITTAPTGTVINGGGFTVPAALGGKTIHPYSDFLLHDIGTGDGIVQNGGAESRNKIRTSPLWGLRTRTRLLHDGSAVTTAQAIKSHKQSASTVTDNYNALSAADKKKLLKFLDSL